MTDMLTQTERILPKTVAGVRFHKVGKVYHFDHTPFPDLQLHDWVIVETARGRQMGEVVAFAAPDESQLGSYRTILRIATPRDLLLRHWQDREPEALELVRRTASELRQYSGVRFVAALYSYDGALLTILYSVLGEERPNLNRLWQELNRHFSAQIELRQIGPRDVAKLLGGFGACGELRCCSTFLTDFSPVSIKMAKMQGISLNPAEITGMCGRLRCCLVYEYEQYVQARQHLPKKNKRVGTPHGEGKVVDVMPLQDAVLVLVGEAHHIVKREDLTPLEELEALAKKASEPCTKHGDGLCECGAKPGKSAAEAEADAVQDQVDVSAAADNSGAAAAAPEKRSRRRRRGRDKRKVDAAATSEAPTARSATSSAPEAEARAPQKESAPRKPRRSRRGRSKNRGQSENPADGEMKAGNS
jgi:cell fate regulator YaaT (PSP1 superfamily)